MAKNANISRVGVTVDNIVRYTASSLTVVSYSLLLFITDVTAIMCHG